jgi:hypothetical protein
VFSDLWGYPLVGCEYQDLELDTVRTREERRTYVLRGSEIEASGGRPYYSNHPSCLKQTPYRSTERRRLAEAILSLAEQDYPSLGAIFALHHHRNSMRISCCLEVD